MQKPKNLTPQELEEKRLEFEESYSFKFDEKENCHTFEMESKRAFIINLSKDEFHIRIVPFFMRRAALAEIVDSMFELSAKETLTQSNKFVSTSMEIIGNMLDNSKMGSIEAYINHIWELAKREDNIPKIIDTFSAVIAMIDFAVEKDLKYMTKEYMQELHDDFMKEQMGAFKVFAIKSDGQVVDVYGNKDVPEQEPEDKPKYDLENMTPLNIKEI